MVFSSSICFFIKKWLLFHHISLPRFWFLLWSDGFSNTVQMIPSHYHEEEEDHEFEDVGEEKQFTFRFPTFQEFSTVSYQVPESFQRKPEEEEEEEDGLLLCEGDCREGLLMEKLGPEIRDSQLVKLTLEPTSQNPNQHNSGFLSEQDISDKPDRKQGPITDPKEYISKPELEHQQLIDQLRLELRSIRFLTLPTILEESESPQNVQTPKTDHGNGDFHHFYKRYTEAMHQFDILNYKKMYYAMGRLNRKPTAPSLKSNNLWMFKHRKSHGNRPLSKVINELQGDLEVVYVGQICITWEFLHWQYMKALNLWNTDPQGIHFYNQVAGEFQQFRVLIQRFIEEEPFQGPRIESYVKSRCVHRSLLQVPVIRGGNICNSH